MCYHLTWEPTGVYAKFSEPYTVSDVQQAFEQISDDSRCDDIRGAIFDYLDVERHNVTKQDAVMVAAFDIGLAYSLPSLRFASVATDKNVLEFWQHFVDVVKIPGRHGVFPTVSSARDWLAVSPSTPIFRQPRRLP